MSVKSILAAALVAGSVLAASAPANAVAFANFNTTVSQSNIMWKNGSSNNTSRNGTIFTTSSPTATTPGSTIVDFNFLVGGLPQGVRAVFTLFGSTTNTPAIFVGGCPGPTCFIIQSNITGSFSFVAQATSGGSQTVGAYTIPDGTNLLTATNYVGALIAGVANGSSAAFTGTDPAGGSITYTSDSMFGLDFANTSSRDFSMTLGSLTVPFNAKPNAALTTFRASDNGTFGSEPSPSVPEPATWALFIAGFGMVGLQVRRRRQASVAA